MRIGVVVERVDPADEAGRWAAGFARWLAGVGHSATVLAFEGAVAGVDVQELARGATVLARARAAAAGVAALGADLVLDLGVGWSGDVLMPWVGSRRVRERRLAGGLSRFGRVRAAVSPGAVAVDLSLARLERVQMRSARRVIAVSALVREVLLAQHAVAEAKVSVVPLGDSLGVARGVVDAGARERVRAELGVGAGVLFLGVAADLAPGGLAVGGMAAAITALDLLVYEDADVHLAIAGSPADARWMRLAAASGARIRFLGAVADLGPYLAAADVVVRPTRWDAGGAATLAAVAAGVPVITTRWDGAAAVAEGSGVVLADGENVGALAAAMRGLLEPAVRARMGSAAGAVASGGALGGAEANYRAVLGVLAG